MLRKNASIRFITNSSGVVFQLIGILILTRFLDIYQFALWGVANSLVYIFSSVGNFGMEKNIQKYFPNYNNEKKIFYLFKYIKIVLICLPIWSAVLFILYQFSYFEKFNANNLYILFTLISLLTVVEILIALLNMYMISKNKNAIFDLNEFLIFKFLKLPTYYFLTTNGYSIYFILLATLALRLLFLLRILHEDFGSLSSIFKNLIKARIDSHTFSNFRYSITTYIDKILYVSFLNLLFLFSVGFLENIAISYFTIAILIINNLRPALSFLPSITTRIISINTKEKVSSRKLNLFSFYINSFIFGALIFVTYYLVTQKTFLLFFLPEFDEGVLIIIFLSVISSSINSFYYPNYIELMFNKKELKLLKLNILNYLICFILYFIMTKTSLENFVYIYLIYEINLFIYTFKLSSKSQLKFSSLIIENNKIVLFNSITYTFIFSILIICLYFLQINTPFLVFLVFALIAVDAKNFFVKLKRFRIES